MIMNIKSLQELIENIKLRNIFIFFYLVMFSYALYFEIKFPYYWFDEAINIHFLSERSFFDLLIPGKMRYHVGGQSLYLSIYSLFSHIGMSHFYVFGINSILLMGIFYNLYNLAKWKKMSNTIVIGMLLMLSFNPYLIYYICEFKQYMLDILISLYLFRIFLEDRVLSIGYIKMIFLLMFSITPAFFLPQAFVVSFKNNKTVA